MGPLESFGTNQLLELLRPFAVGFVLAVVAMAFWISLDFALSAKR